MDDEDLALVRFFWGAGDIELESADANAEDFCGGKGGKPGPCPSGRADDDDPSDQRPHVQANRKLADTIAAQPEYAALHAAGEKIGKNPKAKRQAVKELYQAVEPMMQTRVEAALAADPGIPPNRLRTQAKRMAQELAKSVTDRGNFTPDGDFKGISPSAYEYAFATTIGVELRPRGKDGLVADTPRARALERAFLGMELPHETRDLDSPRPLDLMTPEQRAAASAGARVLAAKKPPRR